MSEPDYEKSCGICGMIPHHSKCRVRELEAQLAEANAVIVHRDGLISDYNSQLELWMKRARGFEAQLERSQCGHIVVEMVAARAPQADEYMDGRLVPGYCAGCRREADAVRRGREEAAQICDRWSQSVWDVFRDQAMAVKQRADEIRALAPASQPTTKPTEAEVTDSVFGELIECEHGHPRYCCVACQDKPTIERHKSREEIQNIADVDHDNRSEHAKEGEK